MDIEGYLGRVTRVLKAVEDKEIHLLVQGLKDARSVHVAGAGRSGTIARFFVAGLVRDGLRAFAHGDASAPAPTAGDLLLVCSASGRTPEMHCVAEEAVAAGTRVVLLTAAALAPLGRLAHQKILLPPLLPATPTSPILVVTPPERELLGHLRELFEHAALVFLEHVRAWLQPAGPAASPHSGDRS